MVARTAVALALLAAVSGCVQGDAGAGPWRFGGVFEEEAAQSEFDDLARRMAAHGGDTVFMESYPVQFMVRGLSSLDCPTAKQEAAGLAYVRSVTECQAETTAASPDSPAGDHP